MVSSIAGKIRPRNFAAYVFGQMVTLAVSRFSKIRHPSLSTPSWSLHGPKPIGKIAVYRNAFRVALLRLIRSTAILST